MQVSRKNPLPLYLQIRENIRGLIERGELQRGQALAVETELAKQYRVSRSTIKHALRELAREGLIIRIKRKGTFVSLRQSSAPKPIQRTNAIAFIIPDMEDMFLTEIYRGVAAGAREAGYKVWVLSSDRDIQKEADNISALKERREKGAIIFPNWGRTNAEQIFALKQENIPFVLVSRYFRDIQTDYVVTDNRTAAFQAVEHLIRLGHRRIACIGWVPCTAIEDRLEGYRLALGRHGIPYDESLVTSIAEELTTKYAGMEPGSGGYEEMKRLLSLEERPTAVFALSDRLAISAMRAIREARLNIPEDIALVGFDNVRYAADLDLTTVAQPAAEMGKKAVELLVKYIEENERGVQPHKPQQVILPAKLIIRGTCGARKNDSGSLQSDSGNEEAQCK